MFQFRRFPTYAYLIQRRLTEYCSAGFPHSEILGSTPMCGSPRLIAACHVLLRLLMPRHSPCALSSLTFRTTFWFYVFVLELCRLQSSFGYCCVTHLFKLHNFYLLCCLLFTSGISSFIVQFSRCSLRSLLKPDTSIQSLEYLYLSSMVEIIGLEPMTPCLQSRCSPS